MNKKVVTINDVAQKAGVSPSTVSRVISNNPKISPPTREKVLKYMDEMGYHPNAIARSLASKKAGAIGVIMPTTSQDIFLNPFFPEALRGIVKGASNTGYDLLLSTNSEIDEELEVIKHFILGSKVDGIILMSSKVNDKCIQYLTSLDFPFSLIGSPDGFAGQINHVDNDNYMAAYEVTTYLSMKGKKKIAMIVGDEKLIVTKKRVEGYKRALLESNIEFDESLLYTGSFDEQTGYEYGSIIAEMEEKPDAVIVADDLVAYGAVKVFESLDVNIPEDIAVASFNNSILSRYANTPITSVDINAAKLGEESMKLVVQAMEKEVRGKKIITPYTIHKRQSTEG
ncbi:LacI family DNA-binding transcriptional regulator [Proteinivorax tanatarense]|uniref:LacI family DNA-binding transcriptional regulator n=1 Tax=Proteinivorax tanatarense TaxID=1260629 RepID=A0AAU7VJM7_9FIRM